MMEEIKPINTELSKVIEHYIKTIEESQKLFMSGELFKVPKEYFTTIDSTFKKALIKEPTLKGRR